MPVPAHIAFSFLLYVAATQTLGNPRCPYFPALLNFRTAFGWVLLRWRLSPSSPPVRYPSWNIMPHTLPTTYLLVKLLLYENSFELALSPLVTNQSQRRKNFLKFLGIKRHLSPLFIIVWFLKGAV